MRPSCPPNAIFVIAHVTGAIRDKWDTYWTRFENRISTFDITNNVEFWEFIVWWFDRSGKSWQGVFMVWPKEFFRPKKRRALRKLEITQANHGVVRLTFRDLIRSSPTQ
jgi:hypothetical protein